MGFETLERKAQENKIYIKIFNKKREVKEFGVEYKELDENNKIYSDEHLMGMINLKKSYEIHWKSELSFDEATQLLFIYEILIASYPHNF